MYYLKCSTGCPKFKDPGGNNFKMKTEKMQGNWQYSNCNFIQIFKVNLHKLQ